MLAPFPYFFASFVSVSLQSVIPQHHLSGRPADERALLLAACLLAGAVGSLTGVRSSRRLANVRWTVPQWRAGVVGLGFVLAAAFSGILLIATAAAYVACFFAASAASQFLFDALDRRLVAGAGEHLPAHVRLAAASQLLAFVVGPLWFGTMAAATVAHVVLVVGFVVLLVSLAWQVAVSDPMRVPAGAGERGNQGTDAGWLEEAPYDAGERLFFAFTLLTHAAVFVFVSSFLYVAQDYYGRGDAARVTGVVLGVSNLVAAATVMVFRGTAGAEDAGAGWDASRLARTTLVLLVCLGLVAWAPGANVWWLAACALPTGACYGLFLVRARAFASRRSTLPGRSAFLSRFNNLTNAAALTGFGLMFLLAMVAPRGSDGFVAAALATSGTLLVCALAAAGAAAGRLAFVRGLQPSRGRV